MKISERTKISEIGYLFKMQHNLKKKWTETNIAILKKGKKILKKMSTHLAVHGPKNQKC